MFESKYGNVLTVILVIVIVAIVGLLGFLGYDFYQKYMVEQDSEAFVSEFKNEVSDEGNGDGTIDENLFANVETTDPSGTGSSTVKTYKGFVVMGTMEIPAIDFSYPVLEKVTRKSIETSVAILYGAGLNQVGNTVIIGHNYRNGLFFSNNKLLKIDDIIYITDNSGKKLTYKIYNIFETTPEDTSFYQRDTNGKPEVTLSTCTDDSSARLIIEARAE